MDRLTHLLNDLDEISKLERGELVLYKQNFVIQELVKDVFESLSGKAEAMNIHSSIKKDANRRLRSLQIKKRFGRYLPTWWRTPLSMANKTGALPPVCIKQMGNIY